ncbi:zinc ABC transporter ATP-binding protein AztA [Halomonas shantousis]
MTARLTLERLTLAQERRTVLENIHGTFEDGAITALIGANGAGKSTLIQAIMGLLKPLSGQVRCTVPKERRAWLPQQLALDLTFPMSVEELMLTGCWPTHGAFRRYGAEQYRRVQSVMSRLGLSELAHRPLGELSGGQRQRALVGRTLMQEAELLLLDEPFANVDAHTVDILGENLREMADQGATVLVVLHDVEQVAKLADCVLVLASGHGQWTTPEAIATRHHAPARPHLHAPLIPLQLRDVPPCSSY